MEVLPNLIVFVPDEWRGDVLGHVGNPAASTPVLDRLVAKDGVSFSSAFCQNPVSTPSRCSFMSGWYPHVRGHRTMYHMLKPDEPNLLQVLKSSGYRVWWGGKNDLIPADQDDSTVTDIRYQAEKDDNVVLSSGPPEASWRGSDGSDPRYYAFFQGQVGDGSRPFMDRDRATVQAAIQWIRTVPKDQPFAVYLSLVHPHPPYGIEAPWDRLIVRGDLPERPPAPDFSNKPSILRWIFERQGLGSWTNAQWDELRSIYYGMCARMDDFFGQVLKTLQDEMLYDDTAVVFFSDHGDFAGDYGLVEKTQNTFEDCLTRVPLVIKPPRGVEIMPGVRSTLVELVDLPVTVADLLGIFWPHPGFGRSLKPALADPHYVHRDAVFSEGGRLHGETQGMELDSRGGRTPKGIYWPRLSAQRSEGPEHTKAIMCRTERYKYVYRHYEADELYDLAEDPMELSNRIADPNLADEATRLKERVFQWLVETVDVVPLTPDARE